MRVAYYELPIPWSILYKYIYICSNRPAVRNTNIRYIIKNNSINIIYIVFTGEIIFLRLRVHHVPRRQPTQARILFAMHARLQLQSIEQK